MILVPSSPEARADRDKMMHSFCIHIQSALKMSPRLRFIQIMNHFPFMSSIDNGNLILADVLCQMIQYSLVDIYYIQEKDGTYGKFSMLEPPSLNTYLGIFGVLNPHYYYVLTLRGDQADLGTEYGFQNSVLLPASELKVPVVEAKRSSGYSRFFWIWICAGVGLAAIFTFLSFAV